MYEAGLQSLCTKDADEPVSGGYYNVMLSRLLCNNVQREGIKANLFLAPMLPR